MEKKGPSRPQLLCRRTRPEGSTSAQDAPDGKTTGRSRRIRGKEGSALQLSGGTRIQGHGPLTAMMPVTPIRKGWTRQGSLGVFR